MLAAHAAEFNKPAIVMTSPRTTAALLWLGAGILGCGSAGTAPSTAPSPAATGILTGRLAQGSAYDRLWSVPLLYQNAENPLLQELAFQGQLQTQYAYGSDASGNFGSGDLPETGNWGDVDVRRFRLGMKARFLRTLKFHSLLDINPDLSPRIYKRTAEAYLTWAPADAFNLSAGKAELKFTREQEISSREILTLERSQLVNMFYGGELTGAWISGKNIAGGWLYELGAYSNDRTDEFSHFHGGTMILPKIGYNYTKLTAFDNAQVELHYLHNTEPGARSPGDPDSPSFSDALALSNELADGRFTLSTELFFGRGALAQADVFGLTVMPTYYFTDKLQLVTNFQLAGSPQENGVSLPYRYEGQAENSGDARGDAYFAGYAGLDYYFYGHKLKVLSGVKYSYMDGGSGGGDFNGWTFLAGARMAF